MAEQQSKGLTHKLAKRAFAPLAHAAVTAGTAFLTRKGMQLWQDKIQPKIEERGGGRALAKETLETVAEKAGPASGPVGSLAEKVGGDETSSSSSRDAERKQREQRRKQRRRSLEKSGSS
jgi:hypothetical protein